MSTDPERKPLFRLSGEIKTPPFSREARIEAGTLLGLLQNGEMLSLPHSRPMPSIGPRCHELRVPDEDKTWRIIYRIDPAAILLVSVFAKKTRQTPRSEIDAAQARLKAWDLAARAARKKGHRP